jgi:hypothetical protein
VGVEVVERAEVEVVERVEVEVVERAEVERVMEVGVMQGSRGWRVRG